MLIKKPKHKNFEYIPRFYRPEYDKEEKLKKKLGFSRARKFKRKARNPIYWLVIFIVVLYVYLKLRGYL